MNNQDFDLWYLSNDFEDTDPEEIGRLAWAEAYAQATEAAVRIVEQQTAWLNSIELSSLIRQAAENA